ncbi:MAG: transcription antitermination factor NusB [Pontimonas sp.]|nr:transcription antitermination factor NusB [Pontimonas sp.]
MSARHKARKRAVDILFSADINDQPLEDALVSAETRSNNEPERSSSWDYAKTIVEGVLAHREAVDQLLRDTSQSWPLERMPTVDRAVLRVATWELLHNPDIPAAVAIAEAVDLVNELSTEASSGFVHGILAAISKTAERP